MWKICSGIFKVQFLYHKTWRDVHHIFPPWDKNATYNTKSLMAWNTLDDRGINIQSWVENLQQNVMPHEPHAWVHPPILSMFEFCLNI